MSSIFETDLDKNRANYSPLTPLSFLFRTAYAYPEHLAIIHGSIRRNWRETAERCRRLGSALANHGIGKGDTVSVMAPNIPEMFECHFGVPMTGAVLNTLNTRLDSVTLAYILQHGESKVLITDTEYSSVIKETLRLCKTNILVIDIDDPEGPGGESLGRISYDNFLSKGDPLYIVSTPEDEWEAISLNYTSGTTGKPKGVVYHHRGAYLNALSNLVGWNMPHHPTYLWTLPMFHCNGWCFPWSITAVAGTNVCLRSINAENIYAAIDHYSVTHFCGAPVILNLLINAPANERRLLKHKVDVMTAAAPPPPSVLEEMEKVGFSMTHVYGLTETYGPAVICAWQPEWSDLPREEQAILMSRQGISYHALEELQIMNPETMTSLPPDNKSIGETMFRGNVVMKGYLKDREATRAAFSGGWFHSGDLGVTHADGYIQLKDRSKDIIISGGENISSIEIEHVLYQHPAVLEAAVVSKPDALWGETPCAFVSLKVSAESITEEVLLAHCKKHLAKFKVPKFVVFRSLPKTSTGKVQKFKLRKIAKTLSDN